MGLGLTLGPTAALHPSPEGTGVSWSLWREHWALVPANRCLAPRRLRLCSRCLQPPRWLRGSGEHGDQLGPDWVLEAGGARRW